MPDPGVPVGDHLARILAVLGRLQPAATGIDSALGQVLARDVVAQVPLPRFDHAAMDGYAVRAADVGTADERTPVELVVAGSVAAGQQPPAVGAGEAVRIMTGAPVPASADLVVPFEWTDRGAAVVRIRRSAAAGSHIRRQGEDVAAGSVAIAEGTRLAPHHIGLLAGLDVAEVVACRRPRVAIVATGDELTEPGTAPDRRHPAAAPDSNTSALAAAAWAAGVPVVASGPVPDDPELLSARVERMAEASDLVVTTGGVSAGDHDVVKAAFESRPDFWFGSVAVKPGRPQGVGRVAVSGRSVPVVCLPGTPVAAYLSFLLFVVPALRVLSGLPLRKRLRAPLATSVTRSADRLLLLPARWDDAGRLHQVPGHAGHSQRVLAAADAVLVVEPGAGRAETGQEVGYLPLNWWDAGPHE